MQSKAKTVDQYLAELPEDRRAVIEAVRKVILKNLDKDFEEGMQYGMIGYYVPHSVYPSGYHCDPRQPLPYACLASQKNYMSLHLMSVYGGGDHAKWFHQAWAKTGKKLDMGKCCLRFKKLTDLALDVIAESLQRVPAKKYIEHCESAFKARGMGTTKGTDKPRKSARSAEPKSKPSRPARPVKSAKATGQVVRRAK
jgi:Domain of unknown function (DU1801)